MKFVLVTFLTSLIFIGCTYSKKEVDYPVVVTTCDTMGVRFSTTLMPLLNAKCNTSGCHDAASAAGGWPLNDYAAVKFLMDNGRQIFLNSIEHVNTSSPMPKGEAKLSDCEIIKIKAWINAGALQN